MKNFVKGIVFVLFILPVIDCILQILQQSTNHICTCIAAKTFEVKQALEGEEDGGNSVAIGFQVNEAEEYYDEDDE